VQDLFQRYGLTYVSGPMVKQVGSAWKKVFRLSLPNDFLRTRRSVPTETAAVAA
jgi:linoleoyl-CoA desaturase